jgi:hypothetical protein
MLAFVSPLYVGAPLAAAALLPGLETALHALCD